jgi:hypothetical protein
MIFQLNSVAELINIDNFHMKCLLLWYIFSETQGEVIYDLVV